MSEDTNEIKKTHTSMDSAEFEAILSEFFNKHKKSKIGLVSRIAFEFKGQEDLVLEHLHNKYVLGIVSEKGKGKIAYQSEGNTETPKNIEAPAAKEKSKKNKSNKAEDHSESDQNSIPSATAKPKSKKKLFIIVGVIVAVLGVTGFLLKDKIMGKGKGHEIEAIKEKAGSESKAVVKKVKKAMTPQEVEAALDSMDKTKSVPKDTAKKG